MRLGLLLACAALSGSLSYSSSAAESTPQEIEQFGQEMPKVVTASGLKMRVAVMLLSPRIMGACGESAEARVILIDNGLQENLKTLKHELDHLRRFELGEPKWKEDR
jgi:hypothetical protein